MKTKTIRILSMVFFIMSIVFFEAWYEIQYAIPALKLGLTPPMFFITSLARLFLYGTITIFYIYLIESIITKKK